MKSTRRIVIAGAVALAAVAGGGAALAASHDWGSTQRQAVVNDVAGRLGVTPTALQDAFKAALKDQVEAAVKAGTLTRAQADAIEARIASGQGPGLRGPGGPMGMHGGMHRGGEKLTAAAGYLGLTADALRTQLESGKTLADVAKAQGKTVEGLVKTMVDAEQAQLDQAVKDGRLTAAQEQQIVSQLQQRVTDMVNGTFPGPGPGGPGMPGGGPGMMHGAFGMPRI